MSPNPAIPFPVCQSLRIATIILSVSLLLPGCASYKGLFGDNSTVTTKPVPVQAEVKPSGITPPITVIRQGRYTLVELIPRAGQRELQLQIISMDLPRTVQATVGNALQHVLLHSGYSLCAPTPETQPLYALPLPAAHFNLGPMTLHDALTTLAGPAWKLSVNEVLRQVCFTLPPPPNSEHAVSTETKS
ncbi:PilL N-terminal domain-containing protein [Serratia fonticola]|uniref:PFGI-1 class ICE element type IV pilus protein PilL2 n=1 Tax=Serratia fonticola TaxID=47917 RepID=UPI00192BB0FC|nr:PilL N-terminal domain-containing protein [Serratia fonticola]MBL5862107.1 PilL N-terminal domain-containing protein [Serratia fonticola]